MFFLVSVVFLLLILPREVEEVAMVNCDEAVSISNARDGRLRGTRENRSTTRTKCTHASRRKCVCLSASREAKGGSVSLADACFCHPVRMDSVDCALGARATTIIVDQSLST